MRILHTEDDDLTRDRVNLMLRAEGFDIESAALGQDGLDLATLYNYDAVLLDVDLPDITGLEVLRKARLAGVKAPVLMVSGSDDQDTKLKCFAAGCDDFISKPFHKDELLARIRAVVRRSNGHHTPVLTCGDITVDLNSHAVAVGGKALHLTGYEYKILECLMLRRGRTATKNDLLDYLYAGRDEPGVKIIDVFVFKLRRKLYLAASTQPIETIWGTGYALREQIAQVAQ